jgi:hypothetical protein
MLTNFKPRIISSLQFETPQNIFRVSAERNQLLSAILTIGTAMLEFHGYVVDVLMRDLVGHDRRPVCFLVYLWLAAEQQRRRRAVQISYQELAESIGVSKSSAQSAVGWLTRRKLLGVIKQTVTATPRYTVLTPWEPEKSIRSQQKNVGGAESEAVG